MVAATVAKNGKKPNRGTVAKSGSPSTPVSNTAAATGAESVSAQGVNDSVDDVSENQQPKQGASYREAIDAYTCTGNFSCDFQELCTRLPLARIPDVVPRYKIQSDGAARNLPDTSEQTLDEIADLPKTYRTKGKYEFFKPSVQTVTEVIEKHEAITEMFIRGWKVDNSMMEVLSHCWLTLDKLHAISLWNAGLEEDTVNLLARVLPQCHLLRSVVLDSNPIKVSPWCKLLVPESRLQHLSLRFNQISDEGAAKLGAALTSCQLVQLDLTGNLIGDAGTIGLAQGLRTNRTLVSLSLASNRVGDGGAAALATVVSEFALEHEEVVHRRKLQATAPHHCHSPSFLDPMDSPQGSARSSTSVMSKRGDRTPVSKKKEDRNKGQASKKDDQKNRRTSIMPDASKSPKGSPRSSKERPPSLHLQHDDDSAEIGHPFLESVRYRDGRLWIVGNRHLASLNLARNDVTDAGVTSLVAAVECQRALLGWNGPPGLMRFCVQHNRWQEGSAVVSKLNELMATVDPFCDRRMQTPESEMTST